MLCLGIVGPHTHVDAAWHVNTTAGPIIHPSRQRHSLTSSVWGDVNLSSKVQRGVLDQDLSTVCNGVWAGGAYQSGIHMNAGSQRNMAPYQDDHCYSLHPSVVSMLWQWKQSLVEALHLLQTQMFASGFWLVPERGSQIVGATLSQVRSFSWIHWVVRNLVMM